MSAFMIFKDNNKTIEIFNALRDSRSASKTKKVQAALPAELMRFTVRLREAIAQNTSDTIATLLVIAIKHLEDTGAKKRDKLLEKTIQLKKESLESWKIQSVIPEHVYEYVTTLSKKSGLKLSPTIALLVMIGAEKVSENTFDNYWLDFVHEYEMNLHEKDFQEYLLKMEKNEKGLKGKSKGKKN